MIRRHVIRALALALSLLSLSPGWLGPARAADENTVYLETKDGRITIELRPDLAPRHVRQIRTLIDQGFYDGLKFHRVIDGFMAQTGDPKGNGTGGSSLPNIPAEFSQTAQFRRGSVGMARSSDPNSANSQFFICLGDAPFLNGQYTVVGAVTDGLDALDRIKKASPGAPGGAVQNPDRIVRMTMAGAGRPVAAIPPPPPAPAEPPPVEVKPAAVSTPPVPALAGVRERRVALVIGNGRYTAVSRLDNPARDAEAVAAALRGVGFRTVTLKSDLGYDGLRRALRDFSDEARQADWAVVYYAGHGIEVGGVNYLIPVDAELKSDRDVSFEAVPIDQVLASVEGARKLRVVILDACRNNPFAQQMTRSVATRSVGRGLGRIEPEGGTLVAYAAKAGQVASDGSVTEKNSPFVAALIGNIAKPNVEIRKLFGLVHDDVMGRTDRRQEPAVYGTLGGDDYYFKTP